MKLPKLPPQLEKFEGIIRFAIVLFVANFFWKFSFSGDEDSKMVTFWGVDCSYIFDLAIFHIAELSHSLLHIFEYPVKIADTLLTHSNGQGVVVVWGCSGLKQSFIFLCIMMFSRGQIKHKLWYTALGLIVVYIVNVMRIVLLTILVENHRDWFEFVHGFVFKYFFYFIIFMMWVLWEEVMVARLKK